MRLGRGTTVLTAVLALVAGAGLAVSFAAPAAAADPPVVVGLGDSYASGEGAGGYAFETDNPLNRCHRSPLSWQLLATIPNAVGEPKRIHVACSGAVAANVLQGGQYANEPPQIRSVVGTNPSVVLLSIGGNDVNFKEMVSQCYLLLDCTSTALMTGTEARIAAARGQVRTVLEEVVRQAPQATVVLAGYPQLVQGACSGFSTAEAARFDQLSRVVRTAWVGEVMAMRMQAKKVRFVDTIDPFREHGACSPTPWINKVSLSPLDSQLVVESMHPNANGYQAYANATSTVLRTDPMRCTSAGCRIKFVNESVYYTPSGGTVTTMGYIRSAYEAEGEETGYHGYPTTNEFVRPNGRAQSFTRGQFFFRYGTTRAYPTRGYIGTKYTATGEANGRLGYPVSTELTVPSGKGKRQNFQFGSIFFKNGATQAFVSEGAILDKYRVDRYDEGPLGWPKTDHACGLQPGNACRQHFDGSGDSVVYWTPTTGAHKVTGQIRDFYASTGWQNSHPDWLSSTVIAGYPTTDAYVSSWLGEPLLVQDFQVGRIVVEKPNTTGQPVCWYMPGRTKPRGQCGYV